MEVAQVPTDWPEEEVGERSAPIDLASATVGRGRLRKILHQFTQKS
jgi:hypothetical protein